MKIWLPDNQTVSVEWYISHARATGVNHLNEEWAAKVIEPQRVGFGPYEPGDPDRDDTMPEFRV